MQLDKLLIFHELSGGTGVYAVILETIKDELDPTGANIGKVRVVSGASAGTWEKPASGWPNLGDYDIALTNDSNEIWVGDWPSGVSPLSPHLVLFFEQDGASPNYANDTLIKAESAQLWAFRAAIAAMGNRRQLQAPDDALIAFYRNDDISNELFRLRMKDAAGGDVTDMSKAVWLDPE